MIFNDTQSQALAFFIFLFCGIIFGLLLWILLFFEKIFNTKLLFNIVAESLFSATLFVTLFLIENFVFAYDFHLYHIAVLLGISSLTYFLLSLSTRNHMEAIVRSATRLKERFYNTKIMKFLKK